ncbi:hypothetical protein [Nocardiopsis salina]|uniref:hypothetical protein n=1 Tax=Nocardiopsis salina TaxID=245836 RepID=UPI00034976FD|nr:hypothetical protein [Nocardiopsis salina]
MTLSNRGAAHAEESPTEADHHHDARARTLRRSALSAHLTLRAHGAVFASVIDPPPWAEDQARACRSHRLWPVLVGDTGTDDVVLAAPIILYDRPATAEHSRGDLFDSTEIDELLSLRVMTLTDEEKHEARATDPRAAEIVDRCDALTAGDLERMHGLTEEVPPVPGPRSGTDGVPVWATPTEREGSAGHDRPWWDPGTDASVDPATDTVEVAGVALGRGSTVRLRPGPGADAQDLFFADRTATVAGVHHDVDGGIHLAVLLSDDPASELHEWYGRYLYFGTHEVEPCPVPGEGSRP